MDITADRAERESIIASDLYSLGLPTPPARLQPFSGTLRGVPSLVSLDDIADAAGRIRGIARRTPTVEGPRIAHGSVKLFLKCENLQVGGAFKIRGAYNLLSRLVESGNRNGAITYSSGNHGQAVAFAARLLGIPALVVMPTTAPRLKIEGAREHGAEIILEGTTSTHRKTRAETEAARRGLTMIPPFDDFHVIAGQGTVASEILKDCGEIDRIYVPVGGGGLIAGVAAAVKQRRPEIQVVGVEPVGAAKMKASLEAGHPVTLERPTSLADGLLPVRPGDLTFAHARAFVDRIVTVDDAAIARAVVWLFRRAKLVVEPSGAASVAALLGADEAGGANGAGREVLPDGECVVAVLSGGNIAPETVAELAR
jgi:threonine dehydratase